MSDEPAAQIDDIEPRPWLVELKDKAARGDRPRDKPLGRWLGDFLDQDTPNGLLKTELDLLDACAKGAVCEPAVKSPDTESAQAPDRKTARRTAVEPNRIRGSFLRFLALGGDAFAPVHEAGIELHNALIDSRLDLRGGKCVGRLVLTDSVVQGDVCIEDASLGILCLRGSHIAGLKGDGASISVSVLLDGQFVADGLISLSGTKIGVDLDCENATLVGGVVALGVVIGGDAKFSSVTANDTVSLISADIAGSLRCSGATFRVTDDKAADPTVCALDFSRAKIKGDVDLDARDGAPFKTKGGILFVSARIGGDVSFKGALIEGLGTDPASRSAIGAQNVKADGSISFGNGFSAHGQVSFSAAEIAKDLSFSDGTFNNESGYAIFADRSKVSGAIKFQTTDAKPGAPRFQSFGEVFLAGAQCGELNCIGGTFSNPGSMALNCSMINVAGSVYLGNVGLKAFEANGTVRFHTAQIGQHVYAGGGWFSQPQGEALNGEAAKIAGCVFLNGCEEANIDRAERSRMAFKADGKVTFVGAVIGLQLNCQWGRFRNASADRSNGAYADSALDLSTATIGDTVFLGLEETQARPNDPDYQPATIEGSIDLTAATVRVLVDDGLVGTGPWGLRPTVMGEDGRPRRCNLKLDLFSYDRLKGDGVYDAAQRLDWLKRQPEECLGHAFTPQPFEQLVKVLRAMGHDDEADEIALAKRTYARRAKPLWAGSSGAVVATVGLIARIGEIVFVDWFLGYGYRVSRALVILLVLGGAFGWFYGLAFQQGAIVPADKDIRNDPRAAACVNWSPAACPVMVDKPIPLFNPWLYSADVMIPVIGFGQKSAWMPTHANGITVLGYKTGPTSLVYGMQLTETVLGWVGGILLLSFISGLIAKE